MTGLGVLVLIGNAFTAWSVITGKPQKRDLGPQPFEIEMRDKPLTVTAHADFCKPLHKRVGDLECDVRMMRLKMDADKHEIIAAGEDRATRIHARIDGIPAHVIALLKDTKHLIT